MRAFVGTSGWMYSWNPDGLDWYLKNTPFKTVELNVSFYRFPFKNQVKSWYRKTKDREFYWAIKVNNLITHKFKLNEKAVNVWKKFKDLFSILDEKIRFYLFQLPPSFSINLKERLLKFFEEINCEKAVVEFRDPRFYSKDILKEIKRVVLVCSVDSPEIQKIIEDKIIYLRIHGRGWWYTYEYSRDEIREISKKIIEKKPKEVFVYFNNNHAMLKNGIMMLEELNTSR